ncbi:MULTISPECIES: hypothetical protein [Microbacterium]|uniref:hypothetical protein n=1 Tax=Microbacterium TaxID=33882 RepID=UPI002784DEE3|nr:MULTISPECIES: hypothetical protein [Microbacterium]MDQ1075916.1 putative membrane protein [Microbacterium sp. SORGH_AS_0969]MDQ1116160.1 putative membrane protein [Microbacterium testaceum]
MATAPASPRRPADVLGIVAVILAAVLAIPTLFVYLVGLIPEMNAIWWLGIILLPLLFGDGVIVIVLAVIGLIVATRRAGRRVWSIVALGLGILMLVPALLVLVPWSS